jgi:type IV fimbrial biogenesis protein FimT
MSTSFAKRMKGFSIIELMVVVAIIGLLAAIAAPNLGGMVRKQRVRSASFDVFSSLTLARSEAVKRNTSVTITPTNGDWAQGWTVADANGNQLRNQGMIDTVNSSGAPAGMIIIAGPVSATYNGTGRLSAAVAPFQLSANTSDTQDLATAVRCVSIDLSGRPVSKTCACAAAC